MRDGVRSDLHAFTVGVQCAQGRSREHPAAVEPSGRHEHGGRQAGAQQDLDCPAGVLEAIVERDQHDRIGRGPARGQVPRELRDRQRPTTRATDRLDVLAECDRRHRKRLLTVGRALGYRVIQQDRDGRSGRGQGRSHVVQPSRPRRYPMVVIARPAGIAMARARPRRSPRSASASERITPPGSVRST